MAVEIIYYNNENKKENKKLVADMNVTLKELGKISIISSRTNQEIGFVDKRCEITPGWNGIEIQLDEFLPDYEFERRGIIKEIKTGTIIDTKHENQELEAIESILI